MAETRTRGWTGEPAPTHRLLDQAIGSPYGRRLIDGGVGQRPISMVFHLTLLLVCAGWMLSHPDQTFHEPVLGVSVLLSSTWLVLGPVLVVVWERRLALLSTGLREAPGQSTLEREQLRSTTRHLMLLRPVFVVVPVVLVELAYLFGGRAFTGELGLPDSGPVFIAGLVILLVGGVAAGWGLWAAALSLAIARTVGDERGDYSPFAGVTSRSADCLAKFCFPAACIFGGGGAVLLPGICSAAWATDGLARAVLVIVVMLIVLTTAALLAYPAWVLDRQNREERLHFLDRLAVEIEEISQPLIVSDGPFSEADAVRLQSLLEIRMHIAAHTMSQASVALVQRIPVAVIIPLSTTLASWYSLTRG